MSLPAVRVEAESAETRFSPGLREFESRRQNRPFGHFITEEEIRTGVGSDLRNFVRGRLPGLRIEHMAPNSPEHAAFSSRGPNALTGSWGVCKADVYLDGLRVPGGEVTRVPLSSLAGVEWYSPGTVPVRYRAMNARGESSAACGVLLLWTAW